MKETGELELLFQYACEYQFDDFTRLFAKLKNSRPVEEIWEAYLMQAQIKLRACDRTAWTDLQSIKPFEGIPQFPCLADIWRVDAPNRLGVFCKAPDALNNFFHTLAHVRKEMTRWYGEPGVVMVRQLQCEIKYFMGEIEEAMKLAEEQYRSPAKNNTISALSQGLRFRCYLAMGLPRQAEECMLDMIRMSQEFPECFAIYRTLREWANLTTNWSGDTPRFYNASDGKKRPVLEDRLESIRMGIAKTTPLEDPFMRYAELHYEDAYNLRQYYMDFFHVMYWFEAGDYQQAEACFNKLYTIASASGLRMPLVEYGEQILPLLHYVKNMNWHCSQQWLEQIAAQARCYERGLRAYTSTHN